MPEAWFLSDPSRSRAEAFERAAEEAKRELFPELFFARDEPKVPVCRLCEGAGFHYERCKLRSPDGKVTPTVDDLIRLVGDRERKERTLLDLERERLRALETDAHSDIKKKAANQETTEPSEDRRS